jgi:hypothetical protein
MNLRQRHRAVGTQENPECCRAQARARDGNRFLRCWERWPEVGMQTSDAGLDMGQGRRERALLPVELEGTCEQPAVFLVVAGAICGRRRAPPSGCAGGNRHGSTPRMVMQSGKLAVRAIVRNGCDSHLPVLRLAGHGIRRAIHRRVGRTPDVGDFGRVAARDRRGFEG